jgi:hypothetical protein
MAVRLSALRAGRPSFPPPPPPGIFMVLISVRGCVDPRAIVRLGRIRLIEKCNDLIGNRTRDLPAYSTEPKTTSNKTIKKRTCEGILNLVLTANKPFRISVTKL